MKYGIENESNAKDRYIKRCKRRHTNMHFTEPGLLVSNSISFIGATADGIRNCDCCKSTLVEFNVRILEKTWMQKVLFFCKALVERWTKMEFIASIKITCITIKSKQAWQLLD